MMLKTVMEEDKYYTVFNYAPPITQKKLTSKNGTIVTGPGMKPE